MFSVFIIYEGSTTVITGSIQYQSCFQYLLFTRDRPQLSQVRYNTSHVFSIYYLRGIDHSYHRFDTIPVLFSVFIIYEGLTTVITGSIQYQSCFQYLLFTRDRPQLSQVRYNTSLVFSIYYLRGIDHSYHRFDTIPVMFSVFIIYEGLTTVITGSIQYQSCFQYLLFTRDRPQLSQVRYNTSLVFSIYYLRGDRPQLSQVRYNTSHVFSIYYLRGIDHSYHRFDTIPVLFSVFIIYEGSTTVITGSIQYQSCFQYLLFTRDRPQLSQVRYNTSLVFSIYYLRGIDHSYHRFDNIPVMFSVFIISVPACS